MARVHAAIYAHFVQVKIFTFILLKAFECFRPAGLSKERKEMNEGEFWNNLDSFVDQKTPVSKDAGKKEIERVGTWLQEISELDEGPKSSKNPQRYEASMTIQSNE